MTPPEGDRHQIEQPCTVQSKLVQETPGPRVVLLMLHASRETGRCWSSWGTATYSNEGREPLLMLNGDAVLRLPTEKPHGSKSGREEVLRVWEDQHIAADSAARCWRGTTLYPASDELDLRGFPGVAAS